MNDLPTRKSNRLNNYDYSENGAYFITVCTKDMKCILSQIVRDKSVGDDDPGVPKGTKSVEDAVPYDNTPLNKLLSGVLLLNKTDYMLLFFPAFNINHNRFVADAGKVFFKNVACFNL